MAAADLAAPKPKAKDDADGGSVAGESALPDHEDFPWVGEVKGGIVEEAVAEAGTDDGAESHVDGQGVKPSLREAFFLEHPGHDPVAYSEGGCEKESIPGQETEDGGVLVPMNVKKMMHRDEVRKNGEDLWDGAFLSE